MSESGDPGSQILSSPFVQASGLGGLIAPWPASAWSATSAAPARDLTSRGQRAVRRPAGDDRWAIVEALAGACGEVRLARGRQRKDAGCPNDQDLPPLGDQTPFGLHGKQLTVFHARAWNRVGCLPQRARCRQRAG